MLGPVSISIPTLVVELVIFLLTVYLMQALVFTPIRRTWTERDRLIQEGLAASSEGRDEAEQARMEVMRILAEARRESQQSVEAATVAGNTARDELVARASTEFRRQVDSERVHITAEREQMAASLRGRIVDLALAAASTVTGEPYSQPQVRELAAAVVSREGLA